MVMFYLARPSVCIARDGIAMTFERVVHGFEIRTLATQFFLLVFGIDGAELDRKLRM